MPGAQCPLTQNHQHGIRASWNGDILLKWTPYSQERLGPLLLFALNSKVRAGLDLPVDLAGILGAVSACLVILVSKVCLQSAGCGVAPSESEWNRGDPGSPGGVARFSRSRSDTPRDPRRGSPSRAPRSFCFRAPGAPALSRRAMHRRLARGSARRFGKCSTRVLPGDGARTKSSRNFERGMPRVTTVNEVGLEQCATAVKTDAL